MNIKGIFQKGIEEFKRRSALRKENKNLKQRNKVYSEQLVTLGKKAWEEHIDIDQYSNLEKIISSTQDQLNELNKEYQDLNSQKQSAEDTRKQKNDTFENQKKEVEDKKKEVDDQLSERKKALKDAQKEADNAKDRLNDIAKEQESLNRKLSDPQTPDTEKTSIRSKLDAFTSEKETLNNTIKDTGNRITAARGQIEPLDTQSENHQKELDRIRSDQKSEIGELDNTISQLKTRLNDLDKKRNQADKEQSGNFQQLGEQLAAASGENPALTSELSAVHATETEMAAIKSDIDALEARGTEESKGAFNQMLLLSGAALVLLIGLIFLLSWLFSSKEDPLVSKLKDSGVPAPFAEAVGKAQKRVRDSMADSNEKTNPTPSLPFTSPKDMKEASKQIEKATGEIKKQADRVYGKEIVITDEATLKSTLPDMPGWERKEPSYRAQRFGQLEGAVVSASYKGSQSKQVRVTVTDAGHATAILSPYMMIYNVNLKRDDENVYEKVSTHDNIKIIEKFDKRSKRGQLNFIVKGRYLVTMKTTGDGALGILKNFIGKFNFSNLQ